MSSVGGREALRKRYLRRLVILAAVLVLVALLLLTSGHWVLGLIFALAAGAAILVLVQIRTVR
jgi:hypothetical protein